MPRPAGISMTRDQLLALPVSFPLITAGRAWGMGRDKTWQLYRQNALPFATVPLGRSVMVTRTALFEALGLDGETGKPLPARIPA